MPPSHHSSPTTTPTSTPLPTPTPLGKLSRISGDTGHITAGQTAPDGKPLYVQGSQAERQARLGRMSSPLRRGTHESWWTAEQGWFNAVAKVRIKRYDADCRLYLLIGFWTKRVTWYLEQGYRRLKRMKRLQCTLRSTRSTNR